MLKRIGVILFLLFSLKQYAQTYPSSVTTILYAPYTIFLDEYANPMTPKLQASVLFTDFTEPGRNIYLKLKVTGPGMVLETKAGIRPPQPEYVVPGIPYTISGADLDWYFNHNNLNFSGISRAQLEANNNRLPEGLYTFCFEVMDYETNKKISLPSCGSAYLALNDPPIVIAPTCGVAIENLSQQNILFQWQISNTNGNLNVSSLNYQIDLYEVNSGYVNPQNAIMNNQALPIWQSQPISQNSYLYGPAEPPLEKGKRYVYTVKAIEQGKSQIKNNGFSQACWFYYGYPEGGTINLIALPNDFQFNLTDNPYFTWSRPSNVISSSQQVGYQFVIAPLLDGQDPETAIINNEPFYEEYLYPSTTNPKNYALDVLDMMRIKKMKPYVWQVKGISGQQEIAKSPVYKFTGPPPIDRFIAGGFEVQITSLSSFDSITHKVSGKGKVILNSNGQAPEFNFSDIYLTAIGNNTWVMSSGLISDRIITDPVTLTSDSVTANRNAEFVIDSIRIDLDYLYLAGFVNWKFPLAVTGNSIPYIKGKRQALILDNDLKLYSQDYNSLDRNYSFNLLEPGGFLMNLNSSSQVYVHGSKYNLRFNGSVDLPVSVKDMANSTVKISFAEAGQLFFIRQANVPNSESIRLINNAALELRPRDYVLDFSDRYSEGDCAADSTWKGLYVNKAALVVPVNAEESKQISASATLSEIFLNEAGDSTTILVDQNGLDLRARFAYDPVSDTLKFNTFPAVDNEFFLAVNDNVVQQSHLSGKIRVPVLDTVSGFPYFIRMDEYGFGTGYLLNGLNNYSFVFNAAGGQEQTINMTITRAVFKNNNRLEMDMNLGWPHFDLSLNQLQKFCAWGNGNIGFENPNGIVTLTYQANAKASGYDLQVDRIGCGRVANLYSFGISSRIVMSEDIAGEDGAPVVNAYSMYKNPLLTGDYTTMDFTMGDSLRVDSNGVRTDVSNDLTTNLGQTLEDMGAGGSPGSSGGGGNMNGSGGDNPDAIIPNSVYLNIQKVVTIAEAFIPFIDSAQQPKAQDYITVIKQILNSDEVRSAVNTSPEQLVNDLILDAAAAISRKINAPIIKISNNACTKVRTTINNTAVKPVTDKVDTLISKALNKVKETLLNSLGEENEQVKQVVEVAVNSVKTNLTNEVVTSIRNSVENNVTSKITGFIQVGVTNKVTGYVNREIKTVATNIIENGVGNSVNLRSMVDNAETLFKDIGDTIADAVTSINFTTIKNTTENIGNDIVTGISFDRIGQNILNELASKGLSAAVTGLIQNQLGNLGGAGGGVASAILSTVKFDFTNVGDKIKNGEIDQIVKFDPTNIYIKTEKVEVKGQLKFTKDDPVYGDSWQASVFVKLYVPKEDKPISGMFNFINGKTTQGDKFTYWFFGGAVTGFEIPLGSIPLTICGFDGMFYHHMKRMGNPQPTPDNTVNYGMKAGMLMFDTQSKGKILKLNLGLGAEFGGGNFAIQFEGVADVGNTSSFTVATATGTIGYYSADKRFQGVFSLRFNTEPLLCAGGEMGIKVDGKNNVWEVYVGKKVSPLAVKILCKDNLMSAAYFEMKKTGIEAGFMKNVSVEAESPWIGGDNLSVKGWANFGFEIDAYANISFEPSFKINDAYISASASAGIGFDYRTPVDDGSVTIAGVSLSGSLLYKNHERAEVHGDMSGTVTIFNVEFGVNMAVHYDIDSRQKIPA
jgi:hypothetical protein